MQSKTKNFRFTEAMCSDLDKLVSVWHCTATEAVARALNQVSVLEDWKAYQAAQQTLESHPAKQEPQPQEPEESTRRRDTGAAAPQAEPPQDAAAVRPQQPEPDTIIIKADAAPKTDQQPQAQDKPKRLQVRIYIKGQKEKPIKAFSSYDRADLDQKSNQWLKEQGYQTFTESKGTSFRWEV